MHEEALLLSGSNPAEAIKAIVERPDLWSMDCATFVQVVQLNALRETLGDVEFSQYMNEQKQLTQGMIILQDHFSTGLMPRRGYSTDERGRPWSFSPGQSGRGETGSLEQRASLAPIGSEVVFFNPNAPETHAFRFENAIKIGPDRYLAYPVGEPAVSGRDIRKQMERMFPAGDGGDGGHRGKRSAQNQVQISTVVEWEFFD